MTFHDMARSTGITEWPTPRWLVDQLAAEFGPFDLDPAATEANAKAVDYITAEVDGHRSRRAGGVPGACPRRDRLVA